MTSEQVSYKVGDIVHLRSGSPDLTVVNLASENATVQWVDVGLAPVLIRDPKHDNYFVRLIIGTDLFVNVIFGGQLGETISSRCSKGTKDRNKFAAFMVWWLTKIAPSHYLGAPAADEQRALEVVSDLEHNMGVEPKIK